MRITCRTTGTTKCVIRSVAALAVMALLVGPVTVRAQEPGFEIPPNLPESKVPDIENGKALANKLCVGCHVVDSASKGVPQADVPSFPAIANLPNQSIEALSNWLMAPHAPMPDPHLSRIEMRDLAGYILSLRAAP